MFFIAIGLREILDGILRLVVAAAAHDGNSSVSILELIDPLPDVAYQILQAVGAARQKTLRLDFLTAIGDECIEVIARRHGGLGAATRH